MSTNYLNLYKNIYHYSNGNCKYSILNNTIMIFISMLTIFHRSACSFLNVMKIAKLNFTIISPNFFLKLGAVAIDG